MRARDRRSAGIEAAPLSFVFLTHALTTPDNFCGAKSTGSACAWQLRADSPPSRVCADFGRWRPPEIFFAVSLRKVVPVLGHKHVADAALVQFRAPRSQKVEIATRAHRAGLTQVEYWRTVL